MKIIQELRVEPEYFMVGYYGRGFPLFLRVRKDVIVFEISYDITITSQNKIFIHRGQTYERLGSFIKRLTDEFSTAQVGRAWDDVMIHSDDVIANADFKDTHPPW